MLSGNEGFIGFDNAVSRHWRRALRPAVQNDPGVVVASFRLDYLLKFRFFNPKRRNSINITT
jgi:hypothetical protein